MPVSLSRRLFMSLSAGAAAWSTARPAGAGQTTQRRIEQLAMNAVRRVEEGRGCRVVDVSAQKCGWDITSYPPAAGGKQPEARHIEVKGLVKGAGTVTITRSPPGQYTVSIPGVGNGVPQITAYGGGDVFCKSNGWGGGSYSVSCYSSFP